MPKEPEKEDIRRRERYLPKKEPKRKQKKPPVYQECPTPVFDDADGMNSWRLHLFPTVMSLVTHSIHKTEHNYMFESILLLKNLSTNYYSSCPNVSEFVESTLATWQYRKDKMFLFGFGFVLKQDETISKWIQHMHWCIHNINYQMLQWHMVSEESLLIEIRGNNNYVSNTWMRLDILSLANAIILHIMSHSCDMFANMHSFKGDCYEFTNSLMVFNGKRHLLAIEFLHKICISFQQPFRLQENKERISKSLANKNTTGISDFTDLVKELWADILQNDTVSEVHLIATNLRMMSSYLEGRQKNLLFSKKHLRQRIYNDFGVDGKPPCLLARKPQANRNRNSNNNAKRDQALLHLNAAWWDFLCSKTYLLYMSNSDPKVGKELRKEVKNLFYGGVSSSSGQNKRKTPLVEKDNTSPEEVDNKEPKLDSKGSSRKGSTGHDDQLTEAEVPTCKPKDVSTEYNGSVEGHEEKEGDEEKEDDEEEGSTGDDKQESSGKDDDEDQESSGDEEEELTEGDKESSNTSAEDKVEVIQASEKGIKNQTLL